MSRDRSSTITNFPFNQILCISHNCLTKVCAFLINAVTSMQLLPVTAFLITYFFSVDNIARTVKFQDNTGGRTSPSSSSRTSNDSGDRLNLASSFLERTRLLSHSPMDGPSAFMVSILYNLICITLILYNTSSDCLSCVLHFSMK